MKEPKVSVIIPMYKVEQYLRECLDSVVSQTHKDIEVLCVDDGSPDNSAEIAAEYTERYDNFKLIRKENGGQSSARNAAMNIARGKYVYFLDSDDYIDPGTLEELSRKADVDELDIVFFNASSFFESEEIRTKNESYATYYNRNGDYSDICTGQTMFVKMRKNREFRESPCLQFFRRDFLEQNRLRFYEGIIHEDILFTFQCVMLAQRTGYIDKAFYFRRVHDDTTMTKPKTMRNVEGYIISYSEALNFLRNITVEEHAAQDINDFLYWSLYKNAYTIWSKLDNEERKRQLVHGGIVAEHLLYTGQKALAFENQRDKLKRENEKLTKQLAVCKKNSGGRMSRLWKRLKKNLKGFFRCTAERGLGVAVHKALHKVAHASAAFMHRHTSGPVKRFFGFAEKQGYRFAVRLIYVKVRMKIGWRNPLVSFILPVYNVEEFLRECLDSLIRQSMPHIEIICVDDGSTDRSLEILREYAEKDRRIKVLTQQNQYAGAARNLGLSKATGEYVIFLDSDDFFEKDLAKETYLSAKAYKADAVIFDGRRFDNSKKSYVKSWLFEKQFLPKKKVFNCKDCPDTLFQITSPVPWTKMFRRKFVLDTGLQYQRLQNANDLFFTYSALALANRIVTVNRPLVNYRVGLKTNLQSTKKKEPLCFYEACMALHDKLVESGKMNTVRRSYVNAAMNNCVYNLNSLLDPDARLKVYNKLHNGGLEKLEILGHEETYYYNKRNFLKMQQINIVPANEDTSLSVIIPVYNVEQWLPECLDSVLQAESQNLDLEIICVNDGSTDNSLNILLEYADRDSRIHVINKPKNEGLLLARKAGVVAATKSHIIFLDSDDYIAGELYDFIRSTSISETADIIQFTSGVKNHTEDTEKAKWLEKALCPKNIEYNGEKSLTEAYITRSYTTVLWGKVFKADLCKKAFSHLPDEHCYVGEDIFTYFFLSYFAESYVGINTKEYYFYRYGLGVTNNDAMPLEKFKIYCKMAKWCQYTWDVLVSKDPSDTIVKSYEAMVCRMSEDCFRIYKNRIADEDMEEALKLLVHCWKDFPSAQKMAQKMLGISLQ